MPEGGAGHYRESHTANRAYRKNVKRRGIRDPTESGKSNRQHPKRDEGVANMKCQQ